MAIKINFFPMGKEVKVSAGTTIAEAAKEVGINFDLPCGGLGKCGKCAVEVEIRENNQIRLTKERACTFPLIEDAKINIPKSLINKNYQIMTKGIEKGFRLDPQIAKYYIKLEAQSLEEFKTEFERVKAVLKEKGVNKLDKLEITLPLLNQMTTFLAERKGFTLVHHKSQNKVIAIEEGNTVEFNYGMAFDIGTTTVAGYLIDLNTGKDIAVVSSINQQIKYGADVISRIAVATDLEGTKKLQQEVLGVLNNLIEEAVNQAKINIMYLYEVVLTGNTSMHHLVLGISPKSLGRAPYMPVIKEPMELKASDLGISINPNGVVFTFPVIAGFVGGDTVAVILASNQHREEKAKLIIDIGTNGEIVLGSKGKLLTCSTAAGPALEGARITWGMRGAPGAIERVVINNDVSYEVIGKVKPIGIAGSGIIDVAAELLKVGIINQKGRFLAPAEAEILPIDLRKRLGGKGIDRFFIIAYKEETDLGEDIVFNQRDIQELQLAKGAIQGAIKVLMDKVGLRAEDIKEILLAGAFGTHIDVLKGKRIGLIPDFPGIPVKAIGNAAGTGAKLALLSGEEREELRKISLEVIFVELAKDPNFQQEFMQGMFLNSFS